MDNLDIGRIEQSIADLKSFWNDLPGDNVTPDPTIDMVSLLILLGDIQICAVSDPKIDVGEVLRAVLIGDGNLQEIKTTAKDVRLGLRKRSK